MSWTEGMLSFVVLVCTLAIVAIIASEATRPPVERISRPLVVPCAGADPSPLRPK